MAAKIDPRLRAEFREIARDIIARDRDARKHGMAQNTIGEIERAMVMAYKAGRGGVTMEPEKHPDGAVDWMMIPPRGRDTLIRISSGLAAAEREGRMFILVQKADDARGRWTDQEPSPDPRYQGSYARNGIGPLLKLGILAPAGHDGAIALTAVGTATLREYWRRWYAETRSLPIMSVR